MRRFVLFITLAGWLFGSTQFAWGTLPAELQSITGHDILEKLAYSCSSETYAATHRIFIDKNLIRTRLAPQEVKLESRRLTFRTGKISVSHERGLYTLRINGKTYSGKDPCEAVNKVAQNRVNSLFSIFIQEANAREALIEEPSVWDEVVIGASAAVAGMGLLVAGATPLAAGGVATSAAAGTTAVGAAAACVASVVCAASVGAGVALVVSGGAVYLSLSRAPARALVHEIINSDFELFCSRTSLTLQGRERKLLAVREGSKITKVSSAWLSDQGSRNLNLAVVPETEKFLNGLARDCRNSEDAERISRELRSNDFRRNVALLLKNDSPTPIRDARERLGTR